VGSALELYDVAADVGETKNVAGTHPDIVRNMESILATCREESPEYPTEKRKS
jgi:hypothetical protein